MPGAYRDTASSDTARTSKITSESELTTKRKHDMSDIFHSFVDKLCCQVINRLACNLLEIEVLQGKDNAVNDVLLCRILRVDRSSDWEEGAAITKGVVVGIPIVSSMLVSASCRRHRVVCCVVCLGDEFAVARRAVARRGK